MELSAIYHRSESEFAYLYRIRNFMFGFELREGTSKASSCIMGTLFIFMEEFYQDTKEMSKLTSDAIFDYWQAEVSVDFARIQYLFELKDTEGQKYFVW